MDATPTSIRNCLDKGYLEIDWDDGHSTGIYTFAQMYDEEFRR